MILHNPMPYKEAILIMDSRNTPTSAVRHQPFHSAWSRLYKAGDMYLDLSLRPEGRDAVLVGQVIAEAHKPVTLSVVLHGPGGSNRSLVNEYGTFRLSVQEKGDHVLEFDLGEETFWVRGLEVL
ncbi:hypothetical protein [Meiothermus sp.]|uniref:hypothetical protein n=1 Tax=Meiothermus sp. TaxID=1955249 RepID=UPI0021DCFB05|nr:hypothetical protein [Meiothermus sp.]GIW33683.1 MAG: hypothetical protein KatS3mg072_1016 [Meiothermus sp.]